MSGHSTEARGAWPLALALCAGGCTSYTGTTARDAAAVDVPSEATSVDGDATVATDATDDVVRSACAPAFGCDPVADQGCPEGRACGLDPAGDPSCAARGATGVFLTCAETSRCAPGASCAQGRCVRLCCDDDACDDLSTVNARSRCAVKTSRDGLYGCTRPGACDYVLQTGCSAGERCYPSSVHGGGTCLRDGAAAEGEACRAANDCAWPFTCVGVPGVCRRACSTLRDDCPDGVPCLRFSDRPADFGYCES
ncbi:MAG: hypothetical protein R3A52_27165 [Polyangiales bacterium]